MASALQNVLITLCTGLASSTLRRDIRMNGFESLRILCEGYTIPTRQRAVWRLSQILTPKFSTGSVEDALAQWEEGIHRHGIGSGHRFTYGMSIAYIRTDSGTSQTTRWRRKYVPTSEKRHPRLHKVEATVRTYTSGHRPRRERKKRK